MRSYFAETVIVWGLLLLLLGGYLQFAPPDQSTNRHPTADFYFPGDLRNSVSPHLNAWPDDRILLASASGDEGWDPEIRGWFGFAWEEIDEEKAQRRNLEPYAGLYVVSVVSHGPSKKAGLRPGDIITHANGIKLNETGDFPNIPAGQKVTFRVLRAGVEMTITVVPAELDLLPEHPILRLNPTGPSDTIVALDTDDSDKILVSGSRDKTVHVWSLESGNLLQTIRPAINYEQLGRIYDVSLSPDSKLVAVGGSFGNSAFDIPNRIPLYDTNTGVLVRSVGSLEASVSRLAFSPDGKYLVAGLVGDGGLHVWRTSDWRPVPIDGAHGASVHDLTFSREGRFLTLSWDNKIRIFESDFSLAVSREMEKGHEYAQGAFSPDGSRIALVHRDELINQHVDVVDAETLEIEFLTEGASNTHTCCIHHMDNVGWSNDGSTIWAGGSGHLSGDGHRILLSWGLEGKGRPSGTRTAATDIFTELQIVGAKGVAYGTADPAIGVIDSVSEETLLAQPTGRNHLVMYWAEDEDRSKVSFDGSVIHIPPYPYGFQQDHPIIVDIKKRSVSSGSQVEVTGTAPRVQHPAIDLKFFNVGDKSIELNGKKFLEGIQCVSIHPDGDSFIVGAGSLRYYNRHGDIIWFRNEHGNPARANITEDGRLVVVGYQDGTTKWHRLSDGEVLLSLFVHIDLERWIFWTPQGYYDASPGGEDLIGWHVNQGLEREALFYGADRFRDLLYRPDIISNAIFSENPEPAPSPETLLARLPPVVRILGISVAHQGNAQVAYEVVSPSGKPVKDVRVLVDGRVQPQDGTRNVIPTNERQEIELSLKPGDQSISIAAATADGYGELANRGIGIEIDAATEEERNLYAVLVGVSTYGDENLKNLSYADDDAIDFEKVLLQQVGGHYSKVQTRLLTESDATRRNVVEALQWLQNTPTNNDVALFFVAGHGINLFRPEQSTEEVPAGAYYLLPHDVDLRSIASSGVSYASIMEFIQFGRGQKIIFLDTCHSGQVDANGVVNRFASDENGVIVFASSAANQLSIENDDWANGAFTESLLEGIRGLADDPRLPDSKIDHLELGSWISRRVQNLTGGRQTPIMGTSRAIPATVIATIPEGQS